MKGPNYIIIIVLILGFISCKEKENKEKTENKTEISANFEVDHLNIWVENPNKAKEKLIEIGFTAVPDSLSQIHNGQGTAGKYFNFLNGYLELIFVYNQNELEENNKKNKDLDFTKRSNFKKNGALPFSIALKIKDYKVDKIPFQKVKYHQDWMEENMNIYSAKSSKINLKEPSIFVVYPEIESEKFETLSDLERIPEEYAIWRSFYKHSNGAKKITKIQITSNNLDSTTKTIKTVNKIENLTVKSGSEDVMELVFDNNIQGKTFDLRPELPLVVRL